MYDLRTASGDDMYTKRFAILHVRLFIHAGHQGVKWAQTSSRCRPHKKAPLIFSQLLRACWDEWPLFES